MNITKIISENEQVEQKLCENSKVDEKCCKNKKIYEKLGERAKRSYFHDMHAKSFDELYQIYAHESDPDISYPFDSSQSEV